MTKHLPKDQRRAAILDAAVACFAEKGYHETTMDDVVRAAGLSKGALYWHFKSKRELFISLFDMWFQELGQYAGSVLGRELPAAEQLKLIGDAAEHSALSRPDLVRAFLEFGPQAMRDAELKHWFAEAYRTNVGLMQELVEEGMARGEFRRVDPRVLSQVIVAMFDGAFFQRELVRDNPAEALTLRKLIDAILELLRP